VWCDSGKSDVRSQCPPEKKQQGTSPHRPSHPASSASPSARRRARIQCCPCPAAPTRGRSGSPWAQSRVGFRFFFPCSLFRRQNAALLVCTLTHARPGGAGAGLSLFTHGVGRGARHALSFSLLLAPGPPRPPTERVLRPGRGVPTCAAVRTRQGPAPVFFVFRAARPLTPHGRPGEAGRLVRGCVRTPGPAGA
jgi:hypothetical protein